MNDFEGLDRLDREELDEAPTARLAFACAFLVACSTGPQFVPSTDGGTGTPDASDDGATLTEGGDEPPSCQNLECQIPSCDGGDGTTITGTVYDPAEKNPLYNVFVYVPNQALAPIPDGPTCTTCQAAASGKPIAWALTDAKGHFRITHAPAGKNIPLVMQLGKWRRSIVLPNVAACSETALDPVADRAKTRLPRTEGEFGEPNNHIPRIAITTGCDMAQCFLMNRIGIDSSAFTGPNGKGRIHVYGGNGWSDPVYGPPNMGDAYALWGDINQMKKYDIILDTCECSPHERDTNGPAYANMKAYLEAGGRVFSTHYQYNFFANAQQCALGPNDDGSCKGPSDFNGVADWVGDGTSSDTDYFVDTSFPKGKAFADWLDNVTMSQKAWGHASLVDTRLDAKAVHAPASRWLYTANGPYYLSWNTPVGAMPANQCGRAVFSGVHLSGAYYVGPGQVNLAFPVFCGTSPAVDHTANETALEFLFFDLSSCIQDDTQPPPVPH